jgi:hypothetical protein
VVVPAIGRADLATLLDGLPIVEEYDATTSMATS